MKITPPDLKKLFEDDARFLGLDFPGKETEAIFLAIYLRGAFKACDFISNTLAKTDWKTAGLGEMQAEIVARFKEAKDIIDAIE